MPKFYSKNYQILYFSGLSDLECKYCNMEYKFTKSNGNTYWSLLSGYKCQRIQLRYFGEKDCDRVCYVIQS